MLGDRGRHGVEHREDRRDEERQEHQRRVDGVRLTQVRGQPQRDVEQSQQHLQRDERDSDRNRRSQPARRDLRPHQRERARREDQCGGGGHAMQHLRELTRCVDDDVAGAVRNRKAREARAARAHVRSDAHRSEGDGRRRADDGRVDGEAAGRRVRRRRIGRRGEDRHRRERGDQRHRGCPVQNDGDRRVREPHGFGAEKNLYGEQRNDHGERRSDEGPVAFAPRDDDERDDERRDRKRKQAMHPLPERSVGQRRYQAAVAQRPVRTR